MIEDDFQLISVYTRQQAIEDGVLIEAGSLAQEAGIEVHVALTAAAWAECVTVPESCPWQDETGRLWDVLNVLAMKARQSEQPTIFFTVAVNSGDHLRDIELKLVCGPGDEDEPVFTVMLPGED
ncbi:MAG: hypothetical protein NT069_23005 [Planctomycetota bacterium]|nr:hypothetical protein [Planctomycetota bacterium]